MKGLLIRFVVTGTAVLLTAEIIPGIGVEGPSAGIAAVILLALLNALVRPVLYLLSLPDRDPPVEAPSHCQLKWLAPIATMPSRYCEERFR
ncbi:MAG: phage holin family protein [Nitrospirae bacterium]|nr:MAG: phage holin family protein [Nitrospirota bacterium]